MVLKSKAVAAPNIALVKYWGKKDDLYKIPLNDSISITLDEKVLTTTTEITIFDKKGSDVVYLNGKRVKDEKISEWISLVRNRLAHKYPVVRNKFEIKSKNNFPTGAGIASSASGFCALATAICGCLGINDRKEMSILARLGSGSASRSVYGGFVQWKGGVDSDKSYAVQIVDEKYWKGLYDVIAVVDEKEKKISSKEGMENTAATSHLFNFRIDEANMRINRMNGAIKDRNFSKLCEETMKDSNSMHATMLDSWPPVMYMNDVSKEIVYAIHSLNSKRIMCGYTFDAGPNAHIIVEKKNLDKVKKMLSKIKGVKKVIISGVGSGSKLIR
jgi:diphosphomevalonate decarboxylase